MDERPSSGPREGDGGRAGAPGDDDVLDLVEEERAGRPLAGGRRLASVPAGGSTSRRGEDGPSDDVRPALAGARRADRQAGSRAADLSAPDTEDLEELPTSAMDDDPVHDDDQGATAPPAGRQRRARRSPRPGRGRAAAGARSSKAAQPGSDRDLPVAIGVGVALAVAAIVAMTIGPAWGVAFATVVVTLCAAELFAAVQKAGHQPATLLGLVATAALVLAAYWRGERALPVVLVLTVVFTLLWYLVGVSRSAPSANAGITIFAVAYVGLFGSFAALMLRLPDGTGILLGTVLAVVANDVGALFAGRRFGRTPIARSISPNKTLEGALGGAVASIAVSFIALDLIGLEPWESKGGSALALGALVAVLAPIGDLVESMLKRDLAVKDMGSILPGHGGLIDRFDSLLFVLPAAYYLGRLLEIV